MYFFYVCVCVCVCERERERERESGGCQPLSTASISLERIHSWTEAKRREAMEKLSSSVGRRMYGARLMRVSRERLLTDGTEQLQVRQRNLLGEERERERGREREGEREREREREGERERERERVTFYTSVYFYLIIKFIYFKVALCCERN